jgi:hypothetical protein
MKTEQKCTQLPVVYEGIVLSGMSQTPLFHNESATTNFKVCVNLLRAGYGRVQLTYDEAYRDDDVQAERESLLLMLKEASLPGESFSVTDIGKGEALYLFSVTRKETE